MMFELRHILNARRMEKIPTGSYLSFTLRNLAALGILAMASSKARLCLFLLPQRVGRQCTCELAVDVRVYAGDALAIAQAISSSRSCFSGRSSWKFNYIAIETDKRDRVRPHESEAEMAVSETARGKADTR